MDSNQSIEELKKEKRIKLEQSVIEDKMNKKMTMEQLEKETKNLKNCRKYSKREKELFLRFVNNDFDKTSEEKPDKKIKGNEMTKLFNIKEKDVKEFVKERYLSKYDDNKFNAIWNLYKVIPDFKINENIFETVMKLDDESLKDSMNDEVMERVHYVLRLTSQYFMTKTFQAMKVDLTDPNVYEDINNGNIGTPGRLTKMWCGANTHDDRELLGGRFHKPVRLAKFPNSISDETLINPIVKEVDLTAVCSHHLAPFSTKFSPNAKVIISYIPDKYVLGISKLQRVVRFVAQRGWLQEDLTKAIYDEICKVAETDSVYIKLKNIKHSCEFLRGAMSESDGFTTEYFGGHYKEDKEILETVRNY